MTAAESRPSIDSLGRILFRMGNGIREALQGIGPFRRVFHPRSNIGETGISLTPDRLEFPFETECAVGVIDDKLEAVGNYLP